MRAYHPKSWSQQAREMGDNVIANVNSGMWCFEQASRFFFLSLKHPLVKQRAAARFHRAVKNGKVHELPSAVANWEEYKKVHEVKEVEALIQTWFYY